MIRALALITALVLFAAPAQAADANGDFAIKGAGTAPCERYLAEREQRSDRYLIFGGWLTGFLTGVNQFVNTTFDIMPWQSTELLLNAIAAYCQQNPQRSFFNAATAVAQSLGPQRLVVRSDFTRVGSGEVVFPVYIEVLRQVQQRLLELGYSDGIADGQYGPKTRVAIERYQAAVGLSVTGVPDLAMLVRLFYPPGGGAPPPTP